MHNGMNQGTGGGDSSGGEEPPPPPPLRIPDVFAAAADDDSSNSNISVHYIIRHPWQWVMKSIGNDRMTEYQNVAELPSRKLAALNGVSPTSTPSALRTGGRRRRSQAQRTAPMSSTLKIELCDARDAEHVLLAAHGTSSALDGLEDKDELVRTMQRCRCEEKNLSPPSILINWDVTEEECMKIIGTDLPVMEGNQLEDKVAVLKEPMGSSGRGIFFVRTAEDIHSIVSQHRQRALDEPGFLDALISQKGRIPSWVLQAEVVPALLIRGRRKFHIRTYVVIVEKLWSEELLETFIFNRHEVRIAGVPVPENDTALRDREVHITNGNMESKTERVLLEDCEELVERGVKDKVELFVATTIGKDLVRDIAGRIRVSAEDASPDIQKFAVAGLDLMLTEDNRLYLLEVNTNPGCPPEDTVDERFKQHLQGFLHEFTDLMIGRPAPSFLSANEIMERHGVSR